MRKLEEEVGVMKRRGGKRRGKWGGGGGEVGVGGG